MSDSMDVSANQAQTPTITRPDLDDVREVKPKALRPYKVVVLDRMTRGRRPYP